MASAQLKNSQNGMSYQIKGLPLTATLVSLVVTDTHLQDDTASNTSTELTTACHGTFSHSLDLFNQTTCSINIPKSSVTDPFCLNSGRTYAAVATYFDGTGTVALDTVAPLEYLAAPIASQVVTTLSHGTQSLNIQIVNPSTDGGNPGAITHVLVTIQGLNNPNFGTPALFKTWQQKIPVTNTGTSFVALDETDTVTGLITNPLTNMTCVKPNNFTDSFGENGLKNGTTYEVSIVPVNSTGVADYVQSRIVIPEGTPNAPTLTLTGGILDGDLIGDKNLKLSATHGTPIDSDADSYIEVTIDGQGTDLVPVSLSNTFASTSTSPLNITISDGDSWNIVGSDPIASQDLTLNNGTTYTVTGKSVNSKGTGAQSNIVSAEPSGLPSAPTFSLATGDRQLTVIIDERSSDNNGSVITNVIFTGNSDDGDDERVAIEDDRYVLGGLENGTEYTIGVLLKNKNGYGNVASEQTLAPRTGPFAPFSSQISAHPLKGSKSDILPNQLSVMVDELSSVQSGGPTYTYTIDVIKATTGEVVRTKIGIPHSTSVLFTNTENGIDYLHPVNGTDYHIRVTSVNSHGESSDSSQRLNESDVEGAAALVHRPSAKPTLTASAFDYLRTKVDNTFIGDGGIFNMILPTQANLLQYFTLGHGYDDTRETDGNLGITVTATSKDTNLPEKSKTQILSGSLSDVSFGGLDELLTVNAGVNNSYLYDLTFTPTNQVYNIAADNAAVSGDNAVHLTTDRIAPINFTSFPSTSGDASIKYKWSLPNYVTNNKYTKPSNSTSILLTILGDTPTEKDTHEIAYTNVYSAVTNGVSDTIQTNNSGDLDYSYTFDGLIYGTKYSASVKMESTTYSPIEENIYGVAVEVDVDAGKIPSAKPDINASADVITILNNGSELDNSFILKPDVGGHTSIVDMSATMRESTQQTARVAFTGSETASYIAGIATFDTYIDMNGLLATISARAEVTYGTNYFMVTENTVGASMKLNGNPLGLMGSNHTH